MTDQTATAIERQQKLCPRLTEAKRKLFDLQKQYDLALQYGELSQQEWYDVTAPFLGMLDITNKAMYARTRPLKIMADAQERKLKEQE